MFRNVPCSWFYRRPCQHLPLRNRPHVGIETASHVSMRLVLVSDNFIPKVPWELLWLVQAHGPVFGSVKLAPIKYENSFVPRHMKSDEGRFWKSTITVELEFSWFSSSSSFIKTRPFKIYHGNENWNVLPYSTTKMPLSTLIEKNKFSHAYIASRSSRSLHGVTTQVKPQVAQARNMSIGDKRHCCVTSKYKDLYGKKIYRFCNLRKWKDFNKKQLTLLKMCVTWSKGRFMAVLWFLCKPFSLPWTTQERLKHTF